MDFTATLPEVLILLAGGAFVLGYLIINQVRLRIVLLIGTLLYIAYYATVAETPLWGAIYASALTLTANLVGLAMLMVRRSRLAIPAAHRDIYPAFGTLTPGDFRTVVRHARRYRLSADRTLTREGEPVERVYYVISGQPRVSKGGQDFDLPAGTFVGEVALLLGRTSAATTDLAAGSEVLEWTVDGIRHRSARSARFKLALESMISHDLAHKVADAVIHPDRRID